MRKDQAVRLIWLYYKIMKRTRANAASRASKKKKTKKGKTLKSQKSKLTRTNSPVVKKGNGDNNSRGEKKPSRTDLDNRVQ